MHVWNPVESFQYESMGKSVLAAFLAAHKFNLAAFLLSRNAGVPLRISGDLQQSRFRFGEHMSENYYHSLDDFLCWDPYVSTVHCHHLGDFLVDRTAITAKMTDLRFVGLERKGFVAQAIWLAMTNPSGVTQCNSRQSLRTYRGKFANLSDSSLLACFKAVHNCCQFWRNRLHSANHLMVTDDSSLVKDNPRAVDAALDLLNTSLRVIHYRDTA